MGRIDDIARLIVEGVVPGQPSMRIPQTPSQVFSQVFLHNGPQPRIDMSLDNALKAVQEYGVNVGLNPELVQQAVEYTRAKYQFYADEIHRTPEIPRNDVGYETEPGVPQV